MSEKQAYGRRKFLKSAAAAAGLASLPNFAFAQPAKLRIGLMLPYRGVDARRGLAILNGFKLAVAESGGTLGGRALEYFAVDDESEPARAADNVNKLATQDKVDVLIGTVHSGVAMEMVKVARETGLLYIIPGAGLDAATGILCAPNIFRTSFANSQTAFPMGKVLADRGVKKVVTLTWRDAIGEEMVAGFRAGYAKGGGKNLKELYLPFPNVEFQPILAQIASLKPDAVFAFFTGGGGPKLIKEWKVAGLKGKIALCGPGLLTEGIFDEVGDAAEGIETTLHYGDGIETPKNKTFRLNYAKAYKLQSDLYAVHGYDAGLLLAAGLKAVKGDLSRKKELYAAMEKTRVDSPRGLWTVSKAHNPVQDIYLRKVVGRQNTVMGIAIKALDYPTRGCRMG